MIETIYYERQKTKEPLRMAMGQSAGKSRVSYVFRAMNILGHLGQSTQPLCELEIRHFLMLAVFGHTFPLFP